MTDFAAQLPPEAPEGAFARLCWIMERLLAPDGCPWDREQTHASLKQYLIEEAYEVYDAVEEGRDEDLKEELGDVALQVVFHAQLARRDGRFDVDDVLNAVSEKLVRRHPHVFGATGVQGSEEVLKNWEEIKKRERASKKTDASMLAGVPRHLPALQKAERIQNKVRRVGFDWPTAHGALDKVREEFEEFVAEVGPHPDGEPAARQVEEFGDLLFSLVNVGRVMGIPAEEALQATCRKFTNRFRHIERRAEEQERALESMTLEEMDVYWEEAKKTSAPEPPPPAEETRA